MHQLLSPIWSRSLTPPDKEYASLTEFYHAAWDQLGRGVADAKHPARAPTLATISANGFPAQRTVVLRAADRAPAEVEIHTDTLTPKVEELRENNKAALHVWILKSMLQLRLEVCFDILTGLEVADRWNAVPPASRISYGTHPVPGKPIAGPFDYEKPTEQTRFAVLKGHVQQIEVLYLGTKHQRALYKRTDDWCGQWISP